MPGHAGYAGELCREHAGACRELCREHAGACRLCRLSTDISKSYRFGLWVLLRDYIPSGFDGLTGIP